MQEVLPGDLPFAPPKAGDVQSYFQEEGDRVVTAALPPSLPLGAPGAVPGQSSSALGDSEDITCLRVFSFLSAKGVFSDPCYPPSRVSGSM